MAVTFRLPSYLTNFTGQEVVTVVGSPSTIREALEALLLLHPSLRDRMLDEQGELRKINVFLGNECISFNGGLGAKVPDGAQISIIPALSTN